MKRAAAHAESSGAQQSTGDAVQKATLLVWDGGAPMQLANIIVKGDPAAPLSEVSDVFASFSLRSLVCGFDCEEDVERLAAESKHLAHNSIACSGLSWHLVYDRRFWRIRRPLILKEVAPHTPLLAHRHAAACEMILESGDAERRSKKARSDASQLVMRIVTVSYTHLTLPTKA